MRKGNIIDHKEMVIHIIASETWRYKFRIWNNGFIEVIRMAKKKWNGFTEEEMRKINEEVEERIRKERVLRSKKAMNDFIPEILRLGITKYKYEDLGGKFLMDLYKYFINYQDLSEDDKNMIEYTFASDFLFVGSRGIPEGTDISSIITNIRKGLKTYRES